MQIQSTNPNNAVIVIAIPDATARLLEHVADTRGVHIGEMAAILLQIAVIKAAAADRADARMAEGERG